MTRFKVRKSFLGHYEIHGVGGQAILEYWIPAEDLAELNANIIGTIEHIAAVVATEPSAAEHRRGLGGCRPLL